MFFPGLRANGSTPRRWAPLPPPLPPPLRGVQTRAHGPWLCLREAMSGPGMPSTEVLVYGIVLAPLTPYDTAALLLISEGDPLPARLPGNGELPRPLFQLQTTTGAPLAG